MYRVALILLILTIQVNAWTSTLLPPNEEKTLGKKIPSITVFDENGKMASLDSLNGNAWILSPIYTQCAFACSQITHHLSETIGRISEFKNKYHVMSLSFDISDKSKNLMDMRMRSDLPSEWKMAGTDEKSLHRLLDAIDFRFISQDNGQFVHPTLIVIVGSDMTIRQYIYGIDYTADQLRKALEAANHSISWWSANALYIFPVAILGAILMICVLFILFRHPSAIDN